MIWGEIYESQKYIVLSTNIFHKVNFNFLSGCFWHFNLDKSLIITMNIIMSNKAVGL